MAGKLGPFGCHPVEEVGDQWGGLAGAGGQTFVGGCTIDLALDGEEFVDLLDGLCGKGCSDDDTWSGLALYGQAGDLEELAPGMGPTGRLDERGRASGLLEQMVWTCNASVPVWRVRC
jgi:hypothetical protein